MEPPAPALPTYDWYAAVGEDTPLEQGDLLTDFPIPVLPLELADVTPDQQTQPNLPANVEFFDVVVMTQSCDFAKLQDGDDVIMCPRAHYFDLIEEEPKYSFERGGWKKLTDGLFVSAYLMNRCVIPGHEFDYQVVDLGRVFSIPLRVVRRFAERKARVRLLPPYREHLAQAFARQFMRVGLPIDIPKTSAPIPLELVPRPAVAAPLLRVLGGPPSQTPETGA
jgi:hypothetical protein